MLANRGQLNRIKGAIELHVQLNARQSQSGGDQNLRVQARRKEPPFLESTRGPPQDLEQRPTVFLLIRPLIDTAVSLAVWFWICGNLGQGARL